jgi:hypothetical protein
MRQIRAQPWRRGNENPRTDRRAPFLDLDQAALRVRQAQRPWQGSCDAETKAAGLRQSGAFGVRGMKHQRHFGSASDPFDPNYPILARTLTARRDNLKDTIAALEKRLAGRTEQVPA